MRYDIKQKPNQKYHFKGRGSKFDITVKQVDKGIGGLEAELLISGLEGFTSLALRNGKYESLRTDFKVGIENNILFYDFSKAYTMYGPVNVTQ
ncbi:MAG: hypothetical protein NDI94_02835 [Candidatus Woesearchaeota archaeon]|nr:hypothetical protein [Candidatus Woesearchaeota archaeon]